VNAGGAFEGDYREDDFRAAVQFQF